MLKKLPVSKLDSRAFLLWLGGLTLLALILRLVVCLDLSQTASVLNPWDGTDMATYRRVATEILGGQIPSYFYYQPFYYSVLLPLVFGLFGVGAWGIMTVQALLGSASVWLTGLIAARIFGRRAGLAAAVLLALARFHIFYTPFALMAVLQGFWMVLLAYTALRAFETNRWAWWCAAALTAAAAILTRGNALLLLPGGAALFVYRNWSKRRRLLLAAVLFPAIVYLPQLPFALRNLQFYGRWTGPSSAQDAVMALGNTPEAPPAGLVYPPTYHEWMSLANLPAAERTPVSRQVLRWFRREPLAYLELKWRMFLLFWHSDEVPNNVSMEREGAESPLLNAPFLVDFAAIGSLAVAGMFLCWRLRSPKRLLLYFVVIVYCLGTVLFYILARFRLPVVPFCCVFAGAAVDRAMVVWYARSRSLARQRRVLLTALAFCAAMLVVLRGFTLYQVYCERHVVRWVRPCGVVARTKDGLRVYDHGPMLYGGWNLVQVPEGGVTVKKTFIVPDSYDEARSFPAAQLRIAVLGRPGSRVNIMTEVEGGERRLDEFTLQEQRGVEWLTTLLGRVASADGDVEVRVTLIPVRGPVAVAVDRHRDYGRTSLLQGPQGFTRLRAEAAFELEWTRELDAKRMVSAPRRRGDACRAG